MGTSSKARVYKKSKLCAEILKAGSTSIVRSGLQDLGALACRMEADPRPSQPRHATFTRPLILYGEGPVLIAHLSDLHIRPQGMLYQGLVDSNTMCEQAIAHLNRLTPRPDVVIITGDLVDEGLPQEYAMARTLLAGIEQPLLMIPGNHDDRTLMGSIFSPPYPLFSGRPVALRRR
nr:metallophosphoesterase [Pseudomonas syringae]